MSAGNLEPRGTVQRWEYSETAPPKLWHRTRNEALFALDEWTWTEDREKAYVFKTYEEAEEHAKALTAAGVQHVIPFVHSADEALLRERHARHERRLATTMASIPSRPPTPQEVFEREERRHLA
jgi:hypothetical protein